MLAKAKRVWEGRELVRINLEPTGICAGPEMVPGAGCGAGMYTYISHQFLLPQAWVRQRKISKEVEGFEAIGNMVEAETSSGWRLSEGYVYRLWVGAIQGISGGKKHRLL